MTDPIRDWAKSYSNEIGPLPKDHRPAAQRARLLLAYRGARRSPPLAKAYFAFAFAGLILTAVFVWQATSGADDQKAKHVASVPLLDSVKLGVGDPIATHTTPKTLSFPGGTRAVWGVNSSGSLSKLSKNQVELTLEEGDLAMDVKQQRGVTWIVRSGNFRVYVVGTAFTVSRKASSEAFQVQVQRGKVRIAGPDLVENQLLLGSGEGFGWQPTIANPDEKNLELRKPGPEDQQLEEEPQRRKISTADAPEPTRTSAPPPTTWQALARSGKYELAIEEVEKSGVAQVLASSSADDRVLLGNAARYSGRIELGSQAYRSARQAEGPAAPIAAYYLAKIALDSNGDQAGAIRWLQTYLREASSGDLAASARARLMNLLQSSGRRLEAQKIAQEYLTMHPSGPHVQVARDLLKQH